MKNIFLNFIREEDGAALVEYGMALLVVALVGVVALTTVATNTNTLFGAAQTSTNAAVGALVAPVGP